MARRPLKVCVLTAGRGTRMGRLGTQLNKALFPLGDRAVLSQIVAKFPEGTEFVLALGYRAEQVRDYVALAHPGLRVTFVNVPLWEGLGSGPATSLLACEAALAGEPFIFLSCDTLWDGDISFEAPGDWVGVAPVAADESARFCNFRVAKGSVQEIRDKERVEGTSYRAFVGLARIESTQAFWSALRKPGAVAGESQISFGIAGLLKTGKLRAREIEWTDVGDDASYRATAARMRDGFDFSKTDEAIYLFDGRVVKFFADPHGARNRVARAKLAASVFPEIEGQRGQFFSYRLADGETLYPLATPQTVTGLLQWLETELWRPSPTRVDPREYAQACEKFYREKTLDRIAKYEAKAPETLRLTSVNGTPLPALSQLLSRLDWPTICRGIPVVFHGDLQFDNILLDVPSQRYRLIDWRPDFAGRTDMGDLRYDLAKMLGGVHLPYHLIKRGDFKYSEKGSDAQIDWARLPSEQALSEVVIAYAAKRGIPRSQLETLVALIYLNMAPLHEAPFDRLLYALGRLSLMRALGTAKAAA